jgi:hypothetical protein
MSLIRLTYFSRNRIHRLSGPRDDRLADLIGVAYANNRRDDITGGMIHDGKWFAQVLEGDERAVTCTFERILRDPRHSDVSLVTMQPIATRHFPFAWMTAAAWSEDNSDLFMHYSGDRFFDPEIITADRLNDLVEAVVGRITQQQGGASWTTRNVTPLAPSDAGR